MGKKMEILQKGCCAQRCCPESVNLQYFHNRLQQLEFRSVVLTTWLLHVEEARNAVDRSVDKPKSASSVRPRRPLATNQSTQSTAREERRVVSPRAFALHATTTTLTMHVPGLASLLLARSLSHMRQDSNADTTNPSTTSPSPLSPIWPSHF